MEQDNIIKVSAITKSYLQHCALQEITFSIPRQSILGLLGPNGAGKTTLIRILTQIIRQDEGMVYFDAKPITSRHVRTIGYLPEERGLYKDMKVGEQLLFFARLKGMTEQAATTSINQWLEKLEASDWWHKPVSDLSKGMSQKVQFIAAVVHSPKLIILDEPFTGFDPVNADLIKEHIIDLRNDGATIIFSTHRMDSVEEMCDKIIMIHQSKKIIDATRYELREQYRTYRYYLEHDSAIEEYPLPAQVVDSKKIAEGLYQSHLQLLESNSPNELLKRLLEITQVRSFSEQIPSMNEIFIQKVKTANNIDKGVAKSA